jgi:flagellar biosynthetic protein FliP
MSKWKKAYCIASVIFAVCVSVFTIAYSLVNPMVAYAAETGDDTTDDTDANYADDGIDGIHLTVDTNSEEGNMSAPIRILLLLTILSLAPSILIMLTSYTRIIIVLHFVRTAIGTQTSPPNQVLIGLALFLTFFIMWPTFEQINTTVIEPLDKNEITTEQAFELAEVPIREFMYTYTQDHDLALFIDISGESYESYDEVPMTVVIPAFIIGELRQAFIMGFLIYIPFIVIDMVVSSVLMSMGMMMLPPTTIALPFKILLFVLADGWNLIIANLVRTFY